jgi:hypothetical protein
MKCTSPRLGLVVFGTNPTPDPTDLALLRVEPAKAAAHLGDGDMAVARALEAIETLDALERATDYAVRSQPASHTPLER